MAQTNADPPSPADKVYSCKQDTNTSNSNAHIDNNRVHIPKHKRTVAAFAIPYLPSSLASHTLCKINVGRLGKK